MCLILLAGYDLVESKQGKSVCVSFHTAFEGVCLETYNIEVDLTRTVQISRHNIPPYIPLEKLAKESLQTDFKGFLQTLHLYLNALASRKQQISLIKVPQLLSLCLWAYKKYLLYKKFLNIKIAVILLYL